MAGTGWKPQVKEIMDTALRTRDKPPAPPKPKPLHLSNHTQGTASESWTYIRVRVGTPYLLEGERVVGPVPDHGHTPTQVLEGADHLEGGG